MVTRIKICGLTRRQDTELAIELGADALGFIHEPKSPRYIRDEDLKWIAALPPIPIKVAVFGVVDKPVATAFDAIQGVEWVLDQGPSFKRIHVVRPRQGQRPEELLTAIQPASAIHLDAFSESAFGGTGKKVDLDFAAEFDRLSPLPVILAGGLTPENVAEAIEKVRPFAVDLSSGIESSPGIKDPFKMRDFIQAVRSARE